MKKIIIKTELIKKALPKLGAAINTRTPLPALENIYCKAEAGSIIMMSCDTEMTVKYKFEAETEEPAEFLLHYHLFNNVVKMCDQEQIEFEILKTAVKVKTGLDVFTLKFNAKIEEYPILKDIPAGNEISLEELDLPIIVAAAESVGNDKLRPALERVCIDIRKDGTTIVGTNSFIVFKYDLPQTAAESKQLLIPARMVKSIEDLKGVAIRWDEKKFCFESGGLIVVINQSEYRYPDYNAVIPKTDANLNVKKEQLLILFKKLSISTEKVVLLSLSRETIKAEVDDRDSGIKINAEIPCEYSGDTREISLDSIQMLKLLHQSPCNNLELAIIGGTRPVIIRGEFPNYLSLIMPILRQ